ncbi:two-component system NtrC family response regulator [Desulfobaculum xiamenense]|uniref:Two-component system NtrC family response regulator n=1 Tax=Desulfobaculum xiamenense TaxID=995050 RepID=A0A846QST8_9BACT|nr:sigma-54 dependent transcriptional regulator [Desulfobaculum xiamenense]NJB67709.1 two-component system NtrC family response regulator [Desulfobaculum xiamenense]
MASVLVVDVDPFIREYLRNALERTGHIVSAVESVEAAGMAGLTRRFDVAFLDANLPDGDAIGMLGAFRNRLDGPETIVLSSMADPDLAERAMRAGAWDFIVKPCSLDRLTHSLRRALMYRAKRSEALPPRLRNCGIVGNSAAIRQCLEQAGLAAAGRADVLITGETGTGKDIFARAIHQSSALANRPFVVVDCAALPSGLAESILFGHVRGAFTGADTTRSGLIRQADGGTLFLDEVGELPPEVQSTFLRVLQERRYRPVGARHEEASDFRLIAATNRELADMTAAGRFRSDLLFRLNSFVLRLPPLRERREDIAALAVHLLAREARRDCCEVKGASPEFLAVLAAHDWPGNVRELVHVLRAAILAAGGEPTLHPQHLPVELKVCYMRGAMGDAGESAQDREPQGHVSGQPMAWREYRRRVLDEAERRYMADIMRHAGGDARRAMELSGLKSARFYQLLRQHGRDLS